jgi:hypothetical protein
MIGLTIESVLRLFVTMRVAMMREEEVRGYAPPRLGWAGYRQLTQYSHFTEVLFTISISVLIFHVIEVSRLTVLLPPLGQ